ncbi:MAG: hypothetical protein PF488_02500 [Patescibacteria group bacterium]|jgi:hypothetical protein|nr:hypothetical protein [Patescibacteria group bacterium]
MKKIIQVLLIIILLVVVALIIIFSFNPYNLRTKLIGGVINNYLSNEIEDYSTADNNINNTKTDNNIVETDKNPLLNEEQEKTLEGYGVDVSQLPDNISPEMEACFVEKLGQDRADEIVAGSSPNSLEVIKAKNCLGE